jgi:hypothetical protein
MSFSLNPPWLPSTIDAEEGKDQVVGQRRLKTLASSSYTAKPPRLGKQPLSQSLRRRRGRRGPTSQGEEENRGAGREEGESACSSCYVRYVSYLS